MANIHAASFNAPTGILTLTENHVRLESLPFTGSYTRDTFGVQ